MPLDFNWAEPGLPEILFFCFNLGNLLAVAAFTVRGQVLLRMFAVTGALLQALFYLYIADEAIYYGVFWKSLTALVAFGFVVVILRERMGRQFAPELRGLARDLNLLTPGQIEKLFKLGEVRRCTDERCIISQGTRPTELYYLLDGSATVLKDGQPITVNALTFLGEIAFVSHGVATADVLVSPGSLYLAWPVDRLSTLLAQNAQIDIALRGLINHDLARKVSSQPVSRQSSEGSAVG